MFADVRDNAICIRTVLVLLLIKYQWFNSYEIQIIYRKTIMNQFKQLVLSALINRIKYFWKYTVFLYVELKRSYRIKSKNK